MHQRLSTYPLIDSKAMKYTASGSRSGDDPERDAPHGSMTAVDIAPSTGEWGALLTTSTIPVRELAREQVPDEPGVYLWGHGGLAVYVGKATSLRSRVSTHLGAGLSLSGSSLRRNVGQMLFGIPPNITGRTIRQKVTPNQTAAIRDWLLACELSWQQCGSVLEADQLERRLRKEFLPSLNRI